LKRRTQRPDPNADDKDTSSNNKKDKGSQADSTKPDDPQPSDDDRPTLKRRE
jgi:hypothetical protein